MVSTTSPATNPTIVRQHTTQTSRWFWLPIAVVVLALIARLLFVLVLDPVPRITGSDTTWLLQNGRALLDGTINQPPQTGPVYLVYDGLVQLVFGDAAPQILRVLDAVWGALLCWLVFVLGRRYLDRRVALMAALVIAVGPAFIIDSGNLLTEALFMVLLFGGLALYATWSQMIGTEARAIWRGAAVIGLLLALATLTRAVAMLIPAILIVDLLITHRRRALKLIGMLAIVYAVMIGLWTVYYAARWHELVIGAQGVAANVFIGTSSWCGATCVDQQAGIASGTSSDAANQSKYLNGALAVIIADPIGYVKHRLSDEMDAELQPYNTVYYPGESIKALIGTWWTHGHKLSDLSMLTQAQDFWPKAVLYGFHFFALIGGLIGALIGLRRLGAQLLIYGVLVYFLALHFVLTAIPRYLFPLEPIWLLFAAFALISVVDYIGRSRNPSVTNSENTPQGNIRAGQQQ